MNLNVIFGSFYTQEKLSLDNEQIEKFCLDLKNKSSGKISSNYGGWQSNNLTKDESILKPLTDKINSKRQDIIEFFGLNNNINIVIQNYWINVNQKNNFNRPHVHPFSLMAGVYYVKVPENSGRLVFENPIQQHDFVIKSNMIKEFNLVNAGYWCAEPKENDLIMFPSWLKHYVEPSESDEERISIAFNLEIGKDNE